MGISRTERARLRVQLREVYKQLANDPKDPGLLIAHEILVDKLVMAKLKETSDKWKEWS